jgi:hypothetical protein
MIKVFAEPGSVSCGTHRPRELIPAFSSCLEDLIQRNSESWCSDEGRRIRDGYCALVGKAQDMDLDSATRGDAVDWLLDDLFCALDAFAPEGFLFGAHEGDGADFGFWTIPE